MNTTEIHDLEIEIEIAFAKNIFFLPMVFEGGTPDFFELDLFDQILLDADGPVTDWTDASAAAQ